MNRWFKVAIALAAVLAVSLSFSPAGAQEWSKEQKELWQAVQKSWELSSADDLEGFYAMIHEDYSGWGYDSNYPGDKAMVKKWFGYYAPKYTTAIYEIFPVGIVVSGDVGIVHYYYDVVYTNEENEEMERSGRWTDIYKKEKGKWLLIADHGGSDDDDDD